MKMLPDQTGRFAERPHYTLEELDRDCERIISAFLRKRHGEVRFPVTTDELNVLIEQTGASLDAYADLRSYGADVEGVTAFFPDRDPEVSISELLANDPRRENRLRTTLSHEFGHVHLHRHLWELIEINGKKTAGVIKDTVVVPYYGRATVDFTANQPGLSLFHCHIQQHMDYGFKALFRYA